MSTSHERLIEAVSAVPAGAWAVGVSGGADSVALLSLLRRRADLELVVVHLDHQTRGGQSAEDAAFVAALARRWGVECVVRRREGVMGRSSDKGSLADDMGTRGLAEDKETRGQGDKETGRQETVGGEWAAHHSPTQATFRQARLTLFRQVVAERKLDGVILAHHADDQAETILHRLLRQEKVSGGLAHHSPLTTHHSPGPGVGGLAGMAPRSRIGGLTVRRPLLDVPAEALRGYLRSIGQDWREDPSNQSPKYLRNRLRRVLNEHEALKPALLELGRACRRLRDWTRAHAPRLPPRFRLADVADLPEPLLSQSLRRWLAAGGADRDQLGPATVVRLIEMIHDAATPPRQHFPGRLLIHRRGGWIEAG